MIFIGDVHGKYARYKKIIRACSNSIQVGDMGVGFKRMRGMGRFHDYQEEKRLQNPPHKYMVEGNHRFIRGNHDNPTECAKHSQFIPDGIIEDGVMFVGGAVSVDRAWRTEGYDWWEDEELSTKDLYVVVDTYLANRPTVMVTHECPEDVATELQRASGRVKLNLPSRTRQAFQSMWSAHSPKLWVFGHWHHSFDHVLNGTRFVCLNELEVRDLSW